MATHPNNAKYPDVIALAFDQRNLKLTCVYNDHSLYVWDVQNIKRVGKSHSFLFHSACIWGVEMFPPVEHEGGSALPMMPPGSLVTCSSDDTIRVWNLESNLPPDNDTLYKRNIYSNELLKVLYVDPELTYIKDLELSGAGTSEKTDSSYDGRNGVRSIRISPDGKHLASGDRAGNIRIHELQNLQELCRIEAHDAEVLCLEYSRHDSGHRLLASASRDRLIHVFNVDEEYNFVQTLDDHSSSITAVRFLSTHDQLQMVSCGADKSIIFRQLQGTPGGTQYQFSRGHNIAGKTTLYDMEVDSGQKHILTACQDRNIRVYNVSSGKHSKTYKGSIGEDGSLIKVVLDSSGIYSATSCTDKTLCVYDYYSGECMATMFGHSELVTGLRFTNDSRRLVSASGDGCIFVWKVPHDMVVTMHARLAQQAARAGRKIASQIPNGLHLDNENFGPPPPEFFDPNANSVEQPDYRFSVGQLPLWAKKQIADNSSPPASLINRQMDLPKGRWAQRLDAGGITVKSVYDSDSIIQIPLGQEKRLDSDGSKDSSIDSGTELRHYADFRHETVTTSKQDGRDNADFVPCPESYQELTNGQLTKQVSSSKVTLTRGNDITDLTRNRHLTDDSSIGSYKYEDMESTEHDGDVEDYSEGEGESTEPEQRERLMYYPPAEETGSDYTVNAMDVEELRRSQRRLKKNQRPERLTDLPLVSVSASVSGSQESDEDDDEVSTPSADTAERNLLSLLSVSSTESLDHVGQREKYLKNTFESLSGAEQEATKDAAGTSISSQFLVRLSQGGPLCSPTLRNVEVINAAKQTRVNSETSKKREELQRRIEETRRKLQSVGYRSNLKSSQSITDLSHIPEKDGRGSRGANHAHRYTPAGDSVEGTQAGDSNGLRRACSLSDLSNTTPRKLLHAAPVQVSGKLTSKSGAAGSRTLPRHGLKAGTTSLSNNSNMTRSTSMGMLNQSDSESDLSLAQRSNVSSSSRVNGLMRPTISSQNKVTSLGGSKSMVSNQNVRRRGLTTAYSSVNLSQVGNSNNNEDSSSEETSPVSGKSGTRPRSTSIDRSHTSAPSSLPSSGTQPQPQPRRPGGSSLHGRYGSERDLSRPAPQRLTTVGRQGGSKPIPALRQNQLLERSPHELPVKDTDQPSAVYDIVSAPLSQQLCSSVADQLTRTADSVVQLYKRLALEGDQTDHREMLHGLQEAVSEAQRTLRHVVTGGTGAVAAESLPAASKLQDIIANSGQGDQANVVAMMQQYSDMLLTMVQQRMGSTTAPSLQKPS
ncbi:hypothetical protein B7P43_G02967 [Cryptotermes secundus]|uniref:MABP1/WDR62 second WD40 domain-containing protein n=1 Tax=Cryptotermes secundus TaxID=105785 RepID=A0A2J7PM66_9NEOP|nr:hypothetical protein B7P43_G02967 [Cryptotermes secundus]